MQLNNQLKRGYLGIAGLLLLSAGINLGLNTPNSGYEFVRTQFEQVHCKPDRKVRWKLASTPLDMPALPLQNIRLCRA